MASEISLLHIGLFLVVVIGMYLKQRLSKTHDVSDEDVLVEAIVRSHTPFAWHEDLRNGDTDNYDVVDLEILGPEKFAGKHLALSALSSEPKIELFQKVGQRVRFNMAEPDILFEGVKFVDDIDGLVPSAVSPDE